MNTFNTALTLFPTSADVYNYYGEVLLDQNRFEEAAEKFERGKTTFHCLPSHTQTNTNKYIHTHTNKQTNTHTYIHTYTHTYTYTHIHTHIHIHTHTYIHTYIHLL